MEMGSEVDEMEEDFNLDSTRKGVKFMSFAYVFGIISMFLMLLMGLTAAAGMTLQSTIALLCGSGIIYLIGLIMFIAGVVFLFLVGYRKTYTRIKEGDLSGSSEEDELVVF